MDTKQYDIIIVGAGVVGLTFACALKKSGLSIAIIDKQSPPILDWDQTTTDLRVFALNHSSIHILQNLGVWQAIQAHAYYFQKMQVWDAEGEGNIYFDCSNINQNYLGYIVEQRALLASLWQQIQSVANIDCYYNIELDKLVLSQEQRMAQVWQAEQCWQAQVVIGADGRHSKIRQWADIKTQGWSYQQTAIVATVSTGKSHQNTAWQRFLPTGPLAFLPVNPKQCSIVWSVDQHKAEQLLALSDAEFCQQLAHAFDYRLGDIHWVSPRAGFPLILQTAKQYVQPQLALIGDAAHSIHPLAGQGVNLGLLDAIVLAEVMQDALEQQRLFSSFKVLRRYERWRKGDNLLMMGVMDSFKRLFGNQFTPVKWARNQGLNLTNQFQPVKNHIMVQAMGMSGELPKLARS